MSEDYKLVNDWDFRLRFSFGRALSPERLLQNKVFILAQVGLFAVSFLAEKARKGCRDHPSRKISSERYFCVISFQLICNLWICICCLIEASAYLQLKTSHSVCDAGEIIMTCKLKTSHISGSWLW